MGELDFLSSDLNSDFGVGGASVGEHRRVPLQFEFGVPSVLQLVGGA